MVTSHKTAEKKAVAMSNESASAAVAGARPRTLLGEVNEHLTCVLCRGYYIDATTIVECLHSFCRSCIIKHLQVVSYCPDCEMIINTAKPNIKPDKALQDIVYKLVPGLFQREMERRQQFYASRPGSAADATPEQRGEDTERIIFSSEDVISFSLEYVDNTETESISSRSSESSNEIAPNSATGAATRRYLQCPAVVNISHLKKFLGMKFEIDSSCYYIDILYKRVPLSDYYTLMDIAYIYNWKRNEPMRFFYKITDYTAIRSRYGFFDIGRKGSFRERKLSSNRLDVASPALHDSDVSSGTESPVPAISMDQNCKSLMDFNERLAKHGLLSRVDIVKGSVCDDNSEDSNLSVSSIVGLVSPSRQSPELDVEKSQFLNSFELTARNSSGSRKSSSPTKSATENSNSRDCSPQPNVKSEKLEIHQRNVKSEKVDSPQRVAKCDKVDSSQKTSSKVGSTKLEEVASKKRLVCQENSSYHDSKKRKVEENKTEIKLSKGDSLQLTSMSQKTLNTVTQLSANIDSSLNTVRSLMNVSAASTSQPNAQKNIVTPPKEKKPATASSTINAIPASAPTPAATYAALAPKHKSMSVPEHSGVKRTAPASFKISSPKRKSHEEITASQTHKTVSPIKLQVLKPEEKKPFEKLGESPKPSQLAKRLPELKLSIVGAIGQQNPQVINKNQLPVSSAIPNVEKPKEIKHLPASVKTAPPVKNPTPPNDPLKSLFDNCKINIPSSLSITLTDQKNDSNNDLDGRSGSGGNSSGTPKPPPPVHNYIEILKLPDLDANKKPARPELKAQQNVAKSGEVITAKGPVPNLKPISETKTGKSSFTKPQTFQQTFLQAISQQLPEKPKFPNKSKVQMPKLNAMQVSKPGEPKETTISSASQISKNLPTPQTELDKNKAPSVSMAKSDSVLDLSTPHLMQSQLGPPQTKALETMQSIVNLAKKQNYPQKLSSNIGTIQGLQSFTQSTPPKTVVSPSPLRIPITNPQNKQLRIGSPMHSSPVTSPRPDHFQSMKLSNLRGVHNSSPVQTSKSPNLNTSATFQNTSTFTQPSPRSQTRSPSSSPKLVIACPSPKSQSPEEKQLASPKVSESSNSQSGISNNQTTVSEPGSSKSFNTKPTTKILKPLLPNKTSNARSSNATPTKKTADNTLVAPGDLVHPVISTQMLHAQQAFIRQQLNIQSRLGLLSHNAATQWFNNSVAKAHLDTIMKNMSQSGQQEYNTSNKDKK